MGELTKQAAKTIFDGSLWPATLIGIISIPITVVVTFLSSANGISITPVLFGSLFVGYLYADRATSVKRAGVQVGLIGGIPTLLEASEMIEVILSERVEFAVIAAIFIPISIVFTFGITIIGSTLFAIIGEWLSKTARGTR